MSKSKEDTNSENDSRKTGEDETTNIEQTCWTIFMMTCLNGRLQLLTRHRLHNTHNPCYRGAHSFAHVMTVWLLDGGLAGVISRLSPTAFLNTCVNFKHYFKFLTVLFSIRLLLTILLSQLSTFTYFSSPRWSLLTEITTINGDKCRVWIE